MSKWNHPMKMTKMNKLIKNIYKTENGDIDNLIAAIFKEKQSSFCVAFIIPKFKQLFYIFYHHCLDYLSLLQSRNLFKLGQEINIINCSLEIIRYFLMNFPAFPTRSEVRQAINLAEICSVLLTECCCFQCAPASWHVNLFKKISLRWMPPCGTVCKI